MSNPLHNRASQTFYGARFPIIRDSLKPENQAKWDKWTYEQKALFVAKLIREGKMI